MILKNISKKTLAVVLTNMFNDFESSNNVKKLVKKKYFFNRGQCHIF